VRFAKLAGPPGGPGIAHEGDTEVMVNDPVVDDPVVDDPVVVEPVDDPVVDEPVVVEPVDDPVVDEPVVVDPVGGGTTKLADALNELEDGGMIKEDCSGIVITI